MAVTQTDGDYKLVSGTPCVIFILFLSLAKVPHLNDAILRKEKNNRNTSV